MTHEDVEAVHDRLYGHVPDDKIAEFCLKCVLRPGLSSGYRCSDTYIAADGTSSMSQLAN